MPLAATISSPRLLEGDSMTSDEFIRRWEEMPDLKWAELIDGIVYMPSPVSVRHADYESALHLWLGNYALATPGCRFSIDATWMMGERQVPQPDITLRILPEQGGQSGVQGRYHSGAPELIVEVTVSSYSRDFGTKKRLYERIGVHEYLIALPGEEKLLWFVPTPDGFQPLEPGADGIFRSVRFPGLWLDGGALRRLDLQGVDAVLRQGLATPEHTGFTAQLAGGKP